MSLHTIWQRRRVVRTDDVTHWLITKYTVWPRDSPADFTGYVKHEPTGVHACVLHRVYKVRDHVVQLLKSNIVHGVGVSCGECAALRGF